MSKQPKVLLKWEGDTPIKCRLENGGAKVELKPGDCCFADASKAKNISTSYRGFSFLSLDQADEKDVKAAKKHASTPASEKKPAQKAPEAKKEAKTEPKVEKEEKLATDDSKAAKGKK